MIVETFALTFSILGACFIGRHEVRFFAFLFWIIGNVLWIAFSVMTLDAHIFILFIVYLMSNIIGIHDTWCNRVEAWHVTIGIFKNAVSKARKS